jgi:hypothetical protein
VGAKKRARKTAVTKTTTITELHYRVLPDVRRGRRLIELTRPLVLRVQFGTLRIVVGVPKGTQSDLASVPRCLWPLFPPDGQYQEAAIFHDYLYAISAPRWLADALFRYVMADLGVPHWKRWLMWCGVRCLGWIWWSGKR